LVASKKLGITDEKAVPLISSSKDDIGDTGKGKDVAKDVALKGRKKEKKAKKGWKGWVVEEMEDVPVEDAVMKDVNEAEEDHGKGTRRSQRMKRKRE
jgi:hypothetical protein